METIAAYIAIIVVVNFVVMYLFARFVMAPLVTKSPAEIWAWIKSRF